MNSAWTYLVGALALVSLEILTSSTSYADTPSESSSVNSDSELKRSRRRAPFNILDEIPEGYHGPFNWNPTPKPTPRSTPPPSPSNVIATSILPRIKLVAKIAGRIKSPSDLSAIREASEKIEEAITELKQLHLSNQLSLFKRKVQQKPLRRRRDCPSPRMYAWGTIETQFRPDVERLKYFSDELMRLTRSNDSMGMSTWADTVLSSCPEGVDATLTRLHTMVHGQNIYRKSVTYVFIDKLKTSDERFWEKVDEFNTMLVHVQEMGFSVYIIARRIKGYYTNSRPPILSVAELYFNRQASSIFRPLESQNIRLWPRQTYGLVRVKGTGCPVGDWETAWRQHDTEDKRSCNNWSNPLHMDGSWGRNNMEWKFCLKPSYGKGPLWPGGKYCTFAYKGCPQGMRKGNIFWDDEDRRNRNAVSNKHPDGRYDGNTLIEFCCRNTTTKGEIQLPIQKPFFLFPLEREPCQKVFKMTVREEFFYWDCENNRNSNSLKSPHPRVSGNRDIKLYMCYYERTKDF